MLIHKICGGRVVPVTGQERVDGCIKCLQKWKVLNNNVDIMIKLDDEIGDPTRLFRGKLTTYTFLKSTPLKTKGPLEEYLSKHYANP